MRYINIGCLVLWGILGIACSEEEIKPDLSLEEPQYVLPKGEEGSLEALIYDTWERYGTYVLYDFKEEDLRRTWTGRYTNWYAPVKSGNKDKVKKMLEFVRTSILENYTDDFVRANLDYRIFMVDSLCSQSTYNARRLVNVSTREHGIVVSNCGEKMDMLTDADWMAIRNEVQNVFTQGFYGAAPVKPVEFNASRENGKWIDKWLADPEGEYTAQQYPFLLLGFVKGRETNGNPSMMFPTEDQDFADYITVLTASPKQELVNLFSRFPRIKERGLILVSYLDNVLKMGVVATQNKNCPEDKIDEGFFEKYR